jgi:O-antigen/teichoic acid export membrane protein
MNRLPINIAANVIGGIVNAALSMLLVPAYLHFLGIEAYGLVGFFAMLQAVFGLMDLGLGFTLNRGMARLSALPDSLREQRDLLRTLETIYWGMSIVIGLLVIVLAEPIATRWVHAQHLAAPTIVLAVRIMGLITALQFPFSLYQAGLLGLQRQVVANVITSGTTFVRGVGALCILAFISPTVEAFFGWQAAVALAQTVVTMLVIWRALGSRVVLPRPRFRSKMLRSEARFAIAVSANAIIGAFLTQSDKVVLSGLLSLSDFGYYALAGTVASALWYAILPVNTAIFPRLTQLWESGDQLRLIALYHEAAQLVALGVIPAALTLILFPHQVVMFWTHNALTADRTALPIALLVAGTAVNGLVSVPSYLQSAAGWPQLTMYTNAACAVVLIPAVIFMASRFGAPGAAAVWVILNCAYLFITVPIMHTRLLRGEQWRWYFRDVALPLAAASAVGLAARQFMPRGIVPIVYVAMSGAAMLIVAALASDRLRSRVLVSARQLAERRSGAVVLAAPKPGAGVPR